MAKKPRKDMLGGIRFVKLTTLYDLPLAERIREALKRNGVGAVIINDERYQARPPRERARAVPDKDGFRIEVPDLMLEKARGILAAIEKQLEEGDGDA